uniref:Uncharacterized protein n=1 Tax=Rhizophora mucronata TaxID=61149 RepID=A0A2P2JQ55_RHIMU
MRCMATLLCTFLPSLTFLPPILPIFPRFLTFDALPFSTSQAHHTLQIQQKQSCIEHNWEDSQKACFN